MDTKTFELRMMAIPAGCSTQNRACQQGFSPKCNQTLTVKVLGVNWPKTHPVTPDANIHWAAVNDFNFKNGRCPPLQYYVLFKQSAAPAGLLREIVLRVCSVCQQANRPRSQKVSQKVPSTFLSEGAIHLFLQGAIHL
jgi:hypothetical protein